MTVYDRHVGVTIDSVTNVRLRDSFCHWRPVLTVI